MTPRGVVFLAVPPSRQRILPQKHCSNDVHRFGATCVTARTLGFALRKTVLRFKGIDRVPFDVVDVVVCG